MNKLLRTARVLLIAPWPLISVCSETSTPATIASKAEAARLQWWTDARFGMFIHWGPVSLRGTEIGWSRGDKVPVAEYDNLYHQFNPTNFDADAWAATAHDAGMKYLVFTTKHHDGFCNWDSRQTDYNIMHSPFGRDIVKELSQACQRHGVVFCAYHSICDWHNPDYPLGSPGGRTKKPAPNMDRYNSYLKAQLAELLHNYGPLGLLWFDGEWEEPWTAQRGSDLYQFCRQIQPSIIINNRVSKGRVGLAGTTDRSEANPGDYDTPEQQIGAYQDTRPWETCMTICEQWAWKPHDTMKSLEQCLQTLIRCAGGDGNLLFNVGPMPDGRIEPRQVERLQQMGSWLRQNGESIYQTRGGPWKAARGLVITRTANLIYLHVLNWPGPSIALPGIPRKILSCSLLSGGKAEYHQTADRIVFAVPEGNRQPVDTIIKLELDGSALDIPALTPSGNIKASASNVFQHDPDFDAEKACDGDAQTRWATDAATKSAWLEVDLGKPVTFQRVVIDEWSPGGKRIEAFELQAYTNGDWKTFYTGKTVGPHWQVQIQPVQAQRVRLNILQTRGGPTINEFELCPE